MSTMIGYTRASPIDQDCGIQVEALRAAGCTVIRAEKKSGTTMEQTMQDREMSGA
jgi:DNA invertase Pin-like site-specific DNA recombinase